MLKIAVFRIGAIDVDADAEAARSKLTLRGDIVASEDVNCMTPQLRSLR